MPWHDMDSYNEDEQRRNSRKDIKSPNVDNDLRLLAESLMKKRRPHEVDVSVAPYQYEKQSGKTQKNAKKQVEKKKKKEEVESVTTSASNGGPAKSRAKRSPSASAHAQGFADAEARTFFQDFASDRPRADGFHVGNKEDRRRTKDKTKRHKRVEREMPAVSESRVHRYCYIFIYVKENFSYCR